MKKVNIYKMLNDLVLKHRIKVIGVMYSSEVDTNGIAYKDMTDEQLYNLLLAELEKGNELLMVNLGSLIDQEFDLSALNSDEAQSNLSGDPEPYEPNKPFGETKVGGFLADNKDSLIKSGLGILGNFFNKGNRGTTPTFSPPSGGNNSSDLAAILAAQAAEADRQRKEDAAKSRQMWLIGGSIGAVVVIGIILTIVFTRKKA